MDNSPNADASGTYEQAGGNPAHSPDSLQDPVGTSPPVDSVIVRWAYLPRPVQEAILTIVCASTPGFGKSNG